MLVKPAGKKESGERTGGRAGCEVKSHCRHKGARLNTVLADGVLSAPASVWAQGRPEPRDGGECTEPVLAISEDVPCSQYPRLQQAEPRNPRSARHLGRGGMPHVTHITRPAPAEVGTRSERNRRLARGSPKCMTSRFRILTPLRQGPAPNLVGPGSSIATQHTPATAWCAAIGGAKAPCSSGEVPFSSSRRFVPSKFAEKDLGQD